jgi:very-short-patch-repair endonuclease
LSSGYEIDLVVFGADGTKIAIECDGDYWHGDDQFEKDMQRQEILERAGWQFFRLGSHIFNLLFLCRHIFNLLFLCRFVL